MIAGRRVVVVRDGEAAPTTSSTSTTWSTRSFAPGCAPAETTGTFNIGTGIAMNTSRAEKELGWKAVVDLADGIERTITWLCATLEPEPAEPIGA